MDRSGNGQWTHYNSHSASETSTELRLLGNQPDRVFKQNSPYHFDRFPEPLRHPECPPNAGTLNEGTTISSKQTQHGWSLFCIIAAFALSNFALYYAYEALVSPRPALGKLFFPPSTTVFVINVLSQGVAFLMNYLFTSAFENVRWTFASQRTGTRMATFLGLSGATSFLGVIRLLGVRGPHRFWCLQKYGAISFFCWLRFHGTDIFLGYSIRRFALLLL
jgi:putative flippase GtrA